MDLHKHKISRMKYLKHFLYIVTGAVAFGLIGLFAYLLSNYPIFLKLGAVIIFACVICHLAGLMLWMHFGPKERHRKKTITSGRPSQCDGMHCAVCNCER